MLTASPDGVVVDEYLRNPDYPNVFALGTCGAQPPVEVTPGPVGAPDSVYSISKACTRGSTANRAEQTFDSLNV
jgi:hypothetical protein